MKWSRGFVVMLVAVLAILAFVVGRQTSSTSTQSALHLPAQTDVKFATPWTSKGTLSSEEKIKSHVTGSCWTGSQAVHDSDAWRCTAGNFIYDPCFAPQELPQGFSPVTDVACLYAPWQEVVMMHQTKPLPFASPSPADGGNGPSPDWALQLSTGDRCLGSTGMNAELAGVWLTYSCTSGALAGALNTHTEPWTVEYYRRGSDVLYEVGVSIAWGG
jgi:hypothetical protein